ncbi:MULTISPECIES: sensor histidine kinase [Nitrosomonas]|uniref:histidine kinase n=1 Tax=Nitrosomonas europaea (strain ATCC 19718 / CIP 103999 / KCTC 2705 / NBRC 14298) TaxID=228410 RepID=Q82WF2_NITEU|nr:MULTISPECIES: HAMP domain-containing sensor histidine kinase [Nitrosomonas]CAD84639.1 Sensory transduction histidine kinases [Nitrosomonas europaea ATCC 19718]SDW74374.1 Signal transduction histidine kinase [Nitrosomonas europaea]SET28876.1 Signal transduction histidine kinase [Nitrosomonas europaea]SJZ84812.1 Signal transduction histidine kinase [Nitrosomonas europaea]
MATKSLRRQIMLGMLAYTLLLSLGIATYGVTVIKNVEHLIWESLLRSEFEYFLECQRTEAGYRWDDTELLRLFGKGSDTPIPAEFDLPAGVHDGISVEKKQFVVLASGIGPDRSVMTLDITNIERVERQLIWMILGSAAVLVCILVLVTIFGARRLVRPLNSLARAIAELSPDQNGQRVQIEPHAPKEAQVIAERLNSYLVQIDDFVERERKFIRMASHELRTPLAVVVSTAEVALDPLVSPHSTEAHLRRILATAHEMQNLVTLLLALARDPARLQSMMELVDLAELVPSIVQDHRLLAGSKELAFDIITTPPCSIHAPRQIVSATIGNLVRNAIENSEHGTIRVITTGSGVTVQDSGHGVSESERSRIYTQLARAGSAAAGGIGLELIARACAHLGWRLDIDSLESGGTKATLTFR